MKLDLDKFVADVGEHAFLHHQLRYGQSLMDVLYATNPMLYVHVVGTDMDPYECHDAYNPTVDKFFDFLAE